MRFSSAAWFRVGIAVSFVVSFAAGLLPLMALAQTVPPTPTAPGTFYDAGTVKPHGGLSDGVSVRVNRDRIEATNVSLRNLIAEAYGIQEQRIFGVPKELDGKRYDVYAKVVGPDTAALMKQTGPETGARLQPFLAERFGLKAHLETRTLPVFDLVVAKGGAKITADAPSGRVNQGVSRRSTSMQLTGITMAAFGDQIMRDVGRPVLDKTGLSGAYSFKLQWADDRDPAQSDGPTIFTAIDEQLGLRLKPGKGPVTVLVVDQAEAPTPD